MNMRSLSNGTRSIDSLVRQEIQYAKTVNRIYNLKRFTFLFVCTLSQANKKWYIKSIGIGLQLRKFYITADSGFQ